MAQPFMQKVQADESCVTPKSHPLTCYECFRWPSLHICGQMLVMGVADPPGGRSAHVDVKARMWNSTALHRVNADDATCTMIEQNGQHSLQLEQASPMKAVASRTKAARLSNSRFVIQDGAQTPAPNRQPAMTICVGLEEPARNPY